MLFKKVCRIFLMHIFLVKYIAAIEFELYFGNIFLQCIICIISVIILSCLLRSAKIPVAVTIFS